MTDTNPRMNVQGLTIDGRYHVEDFIGAGSITEVWRATDDHLGTSVAIKFAPHEAGDEEDPEWVEYTRRFERAARTAATARGGHIIPILDRGEWDGSPYLVMECVRGARLDEEETRRGAIPADEGAKLLRDILDGLASLHRVGIMHRDVRPANLLHDEDGRWRLTGFELAKSLGSDGEKPITITGERVGTDDYMPPEIVVGAAWDARGDLYAAGVLAWEAMAGRNPLAGPEKEMPYARILRRVSLEVPQLAAVVKGVPVELSTFIARLTALDPAKRPANAMAALESF